jgi:rod shape-determining protein MreD
MMKHGVLQRVDHLVRQLLPASLVILLILLQAVPWRMPQLAGVVPMLPMIGIYYWSLYRPDLLVPSVAFGTGLVNDIVLGTPLGISSLVYLAMQGMTAAQRRFFHGKSFVVVWAGFATLAAGAILIEMVLSSVLFGRVPLAKGLLIEYLMTVFCYPLPSWLFSKLQLSWLRGE